MPDGLYDRDVLIWAETQAALLRRMAAGERLNAEIDWANLIDEVEDVGRSELHACESLLIRAMVHLMKLHGSPESPDVPDWRSETVAFLVAARRRFTPSMRTRLDMKDMVSDACRIAGRSPAVCPFTLDMLLDRDADIPGLAALLHATA